MATNVMNCYLAVLGAGASGTVAAVKAKELGVNNVIILEKAKKPGGCSWYGVGLKIENTKWHKEAGYPDTTDELFRERIKNNNWDANHKLIRKFIDLSGPWFDWLIEKGGVDKYFMKPAKQAAGQQAQGGMRRPWLMFPKRHLNEKSRDPSIGPGWAGSFIVTKMLEECEKLGIQIITEARAREFIKDAKGNITGVLADAKDGMLRVNCKACISAAGGFGRNVEFLKKKFPLFVNGDRYHCFDIPTNTGDLMEVAGKAGAFIDDTRLFWEFAGPVHHPYSYTVFRIIQEPENVYVNLNGERFFCENDLQAGHYPLSKQPKSVCYAIEDQDMTETFGQRYIERSSNSATDSWISKDFRNDIDYEVSLDQSGARGDHVKKADTLEELAVKMKIDPKTFIATIKRYNEFCENKRDLDFYKKPEYLMPIRKPPFYAFFAQRFGNHTAGGIVINENMEVLNTGKKAIPGLFASGDNAGGMITNGQSAGGLLWAATSGYMAGIAASKYINRA